MRRYVFFCLCIVLAITALGCAASKKAHVSVQSDPPDALVSIHQSLDGGAASMLGIAGTTPLAKNFEFGKDDRLWLEFEKRGYAPKRMAVTPDNGQLAIILDRLFDSGGSPIKPYELPNLNRILVTTPDFRIIERKFSSEAVSTELSSEARQALIQGVQDHFAGTAQIIALAPSSHPKRIKTLWRDVHTAIEMVDPVRLKYMARPYMLETRSSRLAAFELGREYQSEAILLISGKQNVETGSMKFGKIGLTTLGTVNSYASGYSRAMASGDSFFVYQVHVPQSSENASIKAILVNCLTGEIAWANRGIWPPIGFDHPTVVAKVMSDLLVTLK